MGALWLYAIIVKVMDTYDLDLKARQQLTNVKFVTRRAKLRMMKTLNKLGMMETELLACTLDHRSRLKRVMALKTTKFIQSKPVVTVSNGQEPPF